MTIIIHTDDPDDLIFAMKAIKDCAAYPLDACGYHFDNGVQAQAKRRKTGWTVWMRKPG